MWERLWYNFCYVANKVYFIMLQRKILIFTTFQMLLKFQEIYYIQKCFSLNGGYICNNKCCMHDLMAHQCWARIVHNTIVLHLPDMSRTVDRLPTESQDDSQSTHANLLFEFEVDLDPLRSYDLWWKMRTWNYYETIELSLNNDMFYKKNHLSKWI